MRAGVLSKDAIIKFLNEYFINTWIPNSELGRTHSLREPIAKRRERESTPFDTTHPLAQAIIRGWKTGSRKGSPVDSFVISPEFELMGKQQFHELEKDNTSPSKYYHIFLRNALVGKEPGLGNIVLTREYPSEEVSDVIRTPTVDNENLTIVLIDTRSFENGGTLTIDILIGREEAEGAFYLFDRDFKLPVEEEVLEEGSLAWTWGESGEKRQIGYRFNRGQFFKLVVTRYWDEDVPYINAFHAKISVEPAEKPESM